MIISACERSKLRSWYSRYTLYRISPRVQITRSTNRRSRSPRSPSWRHFVPRRGILLLDARKSHVTRGAHVSWWWRHRRRVRENAGQTHRRICKYRIEVTRRNRLPRKKRVVLSKRTLIEIGHGQITVSHWAFPSCARMEFLENSSDDVCFLPLV